MDDIVAILDLTPLSLVAETIASLRDKGWATTDSVGGLAVTLDPAPDPAAALAEIAKLSPAGLNVEAVGQRAGARLVVRLVNDVPEVVESPSADPRELFDGRREQDDLLAALDGDATAALRLPMQWRVHATFNFAKLVDVPATVNLTVALSAATVTDHVTATTSSTVHHLVNGDGHRVMVALDAYENAALGLLLLAGIPKGAGPHRIPLHAPLLLPGESSAEMRLVPPASFLQTQDLNVPDVWQRASAHVQVLAAQQVWRVLATSERREADRIFLTFLGYRKSEFVLPEIASWKAPQVTQTLALKRWALRDASPDRLLAVRQVASLYDADATPFTHAGDVRASAEVIYVGLRTNAVAEAVKSSREAHSQAQEAARQTVKTVTELIKGSTERMLAALIAVGAVLTANAGKVLPDETGRLLIVLVAIFLCVLALVSVFLEGPLLALLGKRLKSDLVHQAGLLTDEQRDRIDQLPSLVAARFQTKVVRWAIPVSYLTFAVLLLAFGHPDKYQ